VYEYRLHEVEFGADALRGVNGSTG